MLITGDADQESAKVEHRQVVETLVEPRPSWFLWSCRRPKNCRRRLPRLSRRLHLPRPCSQDRRSGSRSPQDVMECTAAGCAAAAAQPGFDAAVKDSGLVACSAAAPAAAGGSGSRAIPAVQPVRAAGPENNSAGLLTPAASRAMKSMDFEFGSGRLELGSGMRTWRVFDADDRSHGLGRRGRQPTGDRRSRQRRRRRRRRAG